MLLKVNRALVSLYSRVTSASSSKLFLRIFDDPSEDDKLWEDGGITFIDPDSNKPLGNNDAAWYTIEDDVPTPLVVVEATFGTERGQFGDGQLNRFSHSVAPAKLGHTAVMLIPFKGESYSKEGGIKGYETNFASLKYAHLQKIIVQAALTITKEESGEYLLIDFYDIELLKSLIIEKAKERLGSKSDASRISSSIQQKMKDYCKIFIIENLTRYIYMNSYSGIQFITKHIDLMKWITLLRTWEPFLLVKIL